MYSTVTYPSASGDSFAIPFGYVDTDHLSVTLDGVANTSWTASEPGTSGTLDFGSAISGELVITRTTPTTEIVSYADSSTWLESDFIKDSRQARYICEELADRIEAIETDYSEGVFSGFPAVAGANYFIVSTGVNTFAVKTLAETKTILGITTTYSIPDPAGAGGGTAITKFVGASAAGAYVLRTAANMLTDLGLGANAAANTAATLGTAALLNVGTGNNQVVQLNGSAQLPAVSGTLLTGVNKYTDYCTIHQRTTAANDAPGPASATTWSTRTFTHIAASSLSSDLAITIVSGGFQVVNSGSATITLDVDFVGFLKGMGRCKTQLWNNTDSTAALTGLTSSDDGDTGEARVSGRITVAAGATKVFLVRHYVSTANAVNGFGDKTGVTGDPTDHNWAQINIRRVG